MIDMDKKYRTRDGRAVRVLCTDMKNPTYPVIALIEDVSKNGETLEYFGSFTSEGCASSTCEANDRDLVEVPPYDGFKIDEPVMVRDNAGSQWIPRYFAGLNDNGYPTTWGDGQTSWTCQDRRQTPWAKCRRPTPEESGAA